jgi:hypothetical protein
MARPDTQQLRLAVSNPVGTASQDNLVEIIKLFCFKLLQGLIFNRELHCHALAKSIRA